MINYCEVCDTTYVTDYCVICNLPPPIWERKAKDGRNETEATA